MGRQTEATRTATLWKYGKKWNGLPGWVFVSCDLVRVRRSPGILARLGMTQMVKRARQRFGNSKHRAARVLRFKGRQIRKQGHK